LVEDLDAIKKEKRLYFFYFLLRRFVVVVLLVQAKEFALAQIMILICSSVYILAYNVDNMPFNDKNLNYIEIMNESLVLLFCYLVFCFGMTESDPILKFQIGNLFVV